MTIKDKENRLSLAKACESGNLHLVKHLSPLINICKSGNEALIKLLIELGANINKEYRNGWTPLLYACQGHANIVKHLVEKRGKYK